MIFIKGFYLLVFKMQKFYTKIWKSSACFEIFNIWVVVLLNYVKHMLVTFFYAQSIIYQHWVCDSIIASNY